MKIPNNKLSNETIARILTYKLFKPIMDVWQILKTSLGEDNVDFPNIYKKENWRKYIQEKYADVIENIKKSKSRNFTINNRIEQDMIKFNSYGNDVFDKYVNNRISYFSNFVYPSVFCNGDKIINNIGAYPLFYFIIKFKHITVKNEDNRSHDVDDLYLLFRVLPSKKIIGQEIYGTRATCTTKELISSYTHSHLRGDYSYDKYIWSNFCLGNDSNQVPSLMLKLRVSANDLTWLELANSLYKMVCSESLTGHPYRYLSNIGLRKEYNTEIAFNTKIESSVCIHPAYKLEDMICFYFAKYIDKNNLLSNNKCIARTTHAYINIHNTASFVRVINKLFFDFLKEELVKQNLFIDILLKLKKSENIIHNTSLIPKYLYMNEYDVVKYFINLFKQKDDDTKIKALITFLLSRNVLLKYIIGLRKILIDKNDTNINKRLNGIKLISFKNKIVNFNIIGNDDIKPNESISLNVDYINLVIKYINIKLTNDINENRSLII